MDNLVDFKKWSIPLIIEYSNNKGRYVIATKDIMKDSRIVAIKGYSTGIIDSYKKKICSVCYSVNNDGYYDISCRNCNVAYYCSKTCQMYSKRKLNHVMICPLLRKLSTFKSDIHSKSIMKLLLNSFALRKSEEEFMGKKENTCDNDNNDVCNWLSLVPLPSDIEVYEKEIEEMKVETEVIIESTEKNKDENKTNKELNEDQENETEILSSDNNSFGEVKNSTKSKSKKKHKKKKERLEDEDKSEDNERMTDKKRHKHKKDKSKKDKKEEEEKEGNNDILIEKKKKEKSKHEKLKKKDSENKVNEVDQDHNIEKDDELQKKNEENKDKYDLITNTIPYSGTFKDMMNLQSHFEEWTEDMKKEWQKNIHFFKKLIKESKEINEYMIKAVQEYVEKRDSTKIDLNDINIEIEIGNFIMSFASLVESNSFGIWNSKGKCLGRILYPFASYFNHSCKNNCFPVQFKNHIYFYASKDIKKGDEINFSYIDTEGVSIKERQEHLMNDYYFKCQCELCCEEEKKNTLSPIMRKKIQKKKDKGKK